MSAGAFPEAAAAGARRGNPRIAAVFERLAAQGRTALIPFVTAGWPDREATLPVLRALVAGGADVIELGVPFSDPMADGPMIQRANETALASRVGMIDVLAWVRAFRETDAATPIVLMGYANPIERMGQAAFVEACVAAGVDGVIVVDYPPEECAGFAAQLRERRVDPIFLLAPTSTDERIALVAREAQGYVYYVSLKGVTGAGHLDVDDVLSRVARIKEAVRMPVGVGFGIRDGATARAIGAGADAVVIGTRLLQTLEGASGAAASERARAFVAEIRAALDAPAHPQDR